MPYIYKNKQLYQITGITSIICMINKHSEIRRIICNFENIGLEVHNLPSALSH